jgi:hypothetical protein
MVGEELLVLVEGDEACDTCQFLRALTLPERGKTYGYRPLPSYQLCSSCSRHTTLYRTSAMVASFPRLTSG